MHQALLNCLKIGGGVGNSAVLASDIALWRGFLFLLLSVNKSLDTQIVVAFD